MTSRRKPKVKKEPFIPEMASQYKGWRIFYRKIFDIDISLPEEVLKPDNNKKLIIVAEGLTYGMLYDAYMAKEWLGSVPPHYFEQDVVGSVRDSTSTYAILVRPTVYEEWRDEALQATWKRNGNGLTLMEGLVWALKHHCETECPLSTLQRDAMSRGLICHGTQGVRDTRPGIYDWSNYSQKYTFALWASNHSVYHVVIAATSPYHSINASVA